MKQLWHVDEWRQVEPNVKEGTTVDGLTEVREEYDPLLDVTKIYYRPVTGGSWDLGATMRVN